MRRWLVVIAALVLVGAGAVYLYAGLQVYDELSAVSGVCHPWDAADTPRSFTVEGIDATELEPYFMPAPRDVEFRSRDTSIPDLVLRGWWIPGANEAGPTVILVHGRDSCRRDENILLPAGMLHRNGFGVLLIDQRDHGDSDDEDLRFAGGSEEYLDVLGAWDWLAAQGVPATHIGILGMSFGAATTVIAGGEEPRVQAVWEDSAFGDISVAMQEYLVASGYPAFLEPGAVLMARVSSGDDLTAKSPLAEIPAYAGRSLAIVHGAADTTILVSHGERLYAAAQANGVNVGDYWIVPGAGHTRAVIDERAEYEPRLVRFFTDTLGAP
jgi:dipeptidyl aminopeptidase/acylaminoacyl peptidase